jgi:hypothetical protein
MDYLNGIKAFKALNTAIDLGKPPYKYILHRKLYELLLVDYEALCATISKILINASKAVTHRRWCKPAQKHWTASQKNARARRKNTAKAISG